MDRRHQRSIDLSSKSDILNWFFDGFAPLFKSYISILIEISSGYNEYMFFSLHREKILNPIHKVFIKIF